MRRARRAAIRRPRQIVRNDQDLDQQALSYFTPSSSQKNSQLDLPAFECFAAFAFPLRTTRALYFNQEFGSPIGSGSR
jgi:hypothetical protein